MKEKFREWNPREQIKVKYRYGENKDKITYWEETMTNLRKWTEEILEEHEAIDIRLTNRQFYYQLVGKDLIPNADEIYKRICVFLTDSRYAGRIDWESIEDKEREAEKHSEWENVKEIIEGAIYSYRLPRWRDQEYYLEMYCEKKAGINTLQPIADKWHIHFGFNKGYSSASAMYELSKRIAEQIEDGKKARVLYFGDHDASGLDMIRDIHTRLCEFMTTGDNVIDILGDDEDNPNFLVIPVALTIQQIKKYNPPPNPAKMTDPRAKWYITRFGKVSWELDSLKPLELRKIADKSVLEFVDVSKYHRWIKREKTEKKALEDFANKLSKNK
jgi:hypothetical protein